MWCVDSCSSGFLCWHCDSDTIVLLSSDSEEYLENMDTVTYGHKEHNQGPLLLTWFTFNPSMDK